MATYGTPDNFPSDENINVKIEFEILKHCIHCEILFEIIGKCIWLLCASKIYFNVNFKWTVSTQIYEKIKLLKAMT